MRSGLSQVAVTAITATVPRNVIAIANTGGTWADQELQRVMQATGITHVRVAPQSMTTADLAEDAARRLMTTAAVDRDSIGAIVFVSQTPDYVMPATSVLLQSWLGLPASTLAFDINGGCCGYIYGLLQASMLVQSGVCRRVLLLAGDTTTKLLAPADRSVRAVFGDAASATLVEYREDSSIAFAIRSDGAGASTLLVPAGGFRTPASPTTAIERVGEDGNARSDNHLYMDGTGVLTFATKVVPEIIDEVLEIAPWERAEVTLFMLHQANKLMVDILRRKLRVEPAAVPFVCGEIGNTGPASIPVALTVASSQLQAASRLEKAILCGFGVGLSWGAAAVDLSKTRFIPLAEL
jgi:3-oxoacyl-[acyl-carrier-protein] synthase III